MNAELSRALLELAGLTEAGLWTGLIVFLRIAALMALAPAFGEQAIPPRVRLALALAFTLVVAPAAPLGAVPRDGLPLLALGGAELLTGIFLGLMLRLFVMVLQMAGTIAAQATSLSQIFGGTAGLDAMPAIGHILVVAGLALATILGLHLRLAAYMIDSYALIPPGQLPDPATIGAAGLDQVSRSFALAFTLAAPFVLASLIYNITLGVINRAMPQLMVAFVGAPAITFGSLALLLLAAPLMLPIWVQAMHAFLAAPFAP
ncbi:flagellar biosynthetic protein FliR [Pseudoroseicyclus aestuarii]|uniref:Flagellar biosynthetic protein FliR n=1 Tax=Pseudoroseicyclus aestuarii TaxID=1795041 RepID=A0A318T873_9RHOB|nr:flagellar biosynthetic protein FliR [Pseudoroseicyclus aestuarii]PYE84588.1 flagellar biosynthetic protein FliR [Pseudoroseicyclus aestuarii]